MYYYFCSEYPCAIKLNGIYYGLISHTPKCLRVDSQNTLVEILSTDGNRPPLTFVIDHEFLHAPPCCVCVTDLKGGYLIRLRAKDCSNDFEILCQEKSPNAVITVFNENGSKLSIETRADFYTFNYDFIINQASVTLLNNGLVAIVVKNTQTVVEIYDIRDKISRILSCPAVDFYLDDDFCIKQEYCDIAKHKTLSRYKLTGNGLEKTHYEISHAPSFNPDKLPKEVLPYAFLEEFLVGGDVCHYLGGQTKDNAKNLGDFFGNFLGVMPPPTFRDQKEVGLIYKERENLYFVRYFTFEITRRKICNILGE